MKRCWDKNWPRVMDRLCYFVNYAPHLVSGWPACPNFRGVAMFMGTIGPGRGEGVYITTADIGLRIGQTLEPEGGHLLEQPVVLDMVFDFVGVLMSRII